MTTDHCGKRTLADSNIFYLVHQELGEAKRIFIMLHRVNKSFPKAKTPHMFWGTINNRRIQIPTAALGIVCMQRIENRSFLIIPSVCGSGIIRCGKDLSQTLRSHFSRAQAAYSFQSPQLPKIRSPSTGSCQKHKDRHSQKTSALHGNDLLSRSKKCNVPDDTLHLKKLGISVTLGSVSPLS